MAPESPSPTAHTSVRSTAVWLAIFFAAALFLRIGFSLEPGFDDESQRYMYTGNDPYYHDRTVHHILDTGEHLSFDPAINYPNGGYNPNPPIYAWTAAPLAMALDQFTSTPDPVGLALNIMVAVWGALTVLPVYMIAHDLWGRKAGLWAGFLIAVSAPHIQRSVAGYADHDAPTMFFITLALAFLVKGLKALDHRDYVPDWRKSGALGTGVKAAFAHNKTAMWWAALCGAALTATALTWKGYPYAIAIMAIAMALQLLSDHLRKKDSTALFVLYLVPLVMVALLPYLLFYRAFPVFQDTTVIPAAYVVLGAIVAGLLLVPTRQMPSILVFPALAVVAILGFFGLKFFVPGVYDAIFSGLGYFTQSKLYTTIAEARRAELGLVAASFGFFTFLLAFWGFGKALRGAWKGNLALTLMVAWSIVALFMAFRASRFIMNAAPVFAILIAPTLVAIVARLGLEDVRRRYAAQHGQNPVGAAMRSLDTKAVVGALLVGLFLVLPNVWIGVDAAMPADYERKHGLSGDGFPERMFGAFGISYELADNGWLPVLEELATRDTGMPIEDRPAFIAWWDYGHWATGIGKHPTVADPFQNHYNIAGRFLASESEEEAMAWLTILTANADWESNNGAFSPGVESALSERNATLLELGPMSGYDREYALVVAALPGAAGTNGARQAPSEEIYGLYEEVAAGSGKSIGYFAADLRMYPVSSRESGIFYAPVYLANKNPDDFLNVSIAGSGRTIWVQQYELDENNNSVRLDTPRYYEVSTQNGQSSIVKEWVIYNGYLYPKGQTPRQGFDPESGISLQTQSDSMRPTERFANSMYNRAFGHFAASVPAGEGLSHWRVIAQSTHEAQDGFEVRDVVLLEYFRGLTVSGTITDDSGTPLSGVQVGFADFTGATHGVATTGSDGKYTVAAPFADDDDLALVIRSAGSEIYRLNSSGQFNFTREQALEGASVAGIDVSVPRGNLDVFVYEDLNGDGQYDDQNDTATSGASVAFGSASRTTNGDGNASFAGVRPGTQSVTVSKSGFDNATRSVTVTGGKDTEVQIAIRATPSQVTMTFVDFNGTAVEGVAIKGTNADGQQVFSAMTNATGAAQKPVAPGTYTLTVDHNETVGDGFVVYKAIQELVVPFGGQDIQVTITRDS